MVFELGLILGLIVRGVEVVDPGLKACVHQHQILIGQGEVHEDLGAGFLDQLDRVFDLVGVQLGGGLMSTPTRSFTALAMASHFDLVRLARVISVKISEFIAILCTAAWDTPPAPTTSVFPVKEPMGVISSHRGLFVIGVAVDRVAIGAHQGFAVLGFQSTGRDRLVHHFAEGGDTVVGVELDIGQDLTDRVALLLVQQVKPAICAQVDGDDVGVAEQVVQIAECFLIGTNKEDAHEILIFLGQGMHWQAGRDTIRQNETVDLAVAVTGDVGQNCAAVRGLVQALQRDDRVQLVDGPDIGQGLKQREVAVVDVGHFLKLVVDIRFQIITCGQRF